MERLGVAVLSLFSAVIVIVLLVLVAATIVAAQLTAVALIALLPFAVLGGALPGAGRAVLWRWFSSFARALLAILMMSMFLAFLLVTTRAVLAAESGTSLLMRMASLNLVTILAFVARRRMLQAGHRIAGNFGSRLGGMKYGGHHDQSILGPAVVGGATGFGLAHLAREVHEEHSHLTGPMRRAAAWSTKVGAAAASGGTSAAVGAAAGGAAGAAASKAGGGGAKNAGGGAHGCGWDHEPGRRSRLGWWGSATRGGNTRPGGGSPVGGRGPRVPRATNASRTADATRGQPTRQQLSPSGSSAAEANRRGPGRRGCHSRAGGTATAGDESQDAIGVQAHARGARRAS